MTPTQKRANIVRQIDKRIRDAIDTLREEIQFSSYILPLRKFFFNGSNVAS